MAIIQNLRQEIAQAVHRLYGMEDSPDSLLINTTPEHFEGDFTLVTFPLAKAAKKAPPQIAQALGEFLAENSTLVSDFNVVKGFLNLSVKKEAWIQAFLQMPAGDPVFEPTGETVVVEYASPNTNKPLHLGHIRNILLGWSIHKILKATGHRVITTQIVNDRGIAITKSMVAWKKFANGATPQSTGIKGDHFVGDYYVKFATELAKEYEQWQQSPQAEDEFQKRKNQKLDKETFFKKFKDTYFNKYSALGAEARKMLRLWEEGDPETLQLWKTMNGWVLQGFEETFEMLGVSFDETYFESDTYLLGKDIIQEGLAKGVFYKKEDGAVAADLEDRKLGEKIVMRSDGTSLYITQDIGLAHARYEKYKMDSMVYVVGNEQIYHFQALFAILEKLGEPYAKKLFHLAYGMVNLTTGRMKSREGTVVDADDLIEEMIQDAAKESMERNEVTNLPPEEQEAIRKNIALGALKFFILKVNPKKQMIFDPKESIELQGQTGPYIQYAYVRTAGLEKHAAGLDLELAQTYSKLEPEEKEIIRLLESYRDLISEAAQSYDPSVIASFAYNLAKAYSKFWHEHSILKATEPGAKEFRFLLSRRVGDTLRHAMDLLGIQMPQRM